jgi:hypothetical protein
VKQHPADSLGPQLRPAVIDRGRLAVENSNVYRLMIIIVLLLASVAQVTRIVNVKSATGEMPFLSANDRSRWCTILALVANGTYIIDDIIEIRDPQTKRRTWNTIDRIQHRGADGRQHFYSSKPPLLSTIYAGVYWVIRGLTGATLTGQPFVVARWMLIIVNFIPLLFLWLIMLQWASHYGLRPLQMLMMSLFVSSGTFLSTFVITLNNHLPAAVAAGISLSCLQRIVLSDDVRWRWFVVCGLSTSFIAVNELPALAWLVLVSAILMSINRRRTCLAYLPALLPATLAFFAANYIAHGTFRPAYAMRSLGQLITTIESQEVTEETSSAEKPEEPWDITAIVETLQRRGVEISPQASVLPSRHSNVWQLWDEATQSRYGLKREASTGLVSIHHWGDWYDYPDTYWTKDRKQGVDRGEPSRIRYAFHCIIGHHGIFSLTPFWFFSLIGAGVIAIQSGLDTRSPASSFRKSNSQRLLMAAIVLTTMIVVGFYLFRPLEDRNYGGVTSGLRWTFWMIPLWYWLAIRGVARLQGFWPYSAAAVALAISVFSAAYAWGNPWTSPWLMHWAPLP